MSVVRRDERSSTASSRVASASLTRAVTSVPPRPFRVDLRVVIVDADLRERAHDAAGQSACRGARRGGDERACRDNGADGRDGHEPNTGKETVRTADGARARASLQVQAAAEVTAIIPSTLSSMRLASAIVQSVTGMRRSIVELAFWGLCRPPEKRRLSSCARTPETFPCLRPMRTGHPKPEMHCELPGSRPTSATVRFRSVARTPSV